MKRKMKQSRSELSKQICKVITILQVVEIESRGKKKKRSNAVSSVGKTDFRADGIVKRSRQNQRNDDTR